MAPSWKSETSDEYSFWPARTRKSPSPSATSKLGRTKSPLPSTRIYSHRSTETSLPTVSCSSLAAHPTIGDCLTRTRSKTVARPTRISASPLSTGAQTQTAPNNSSNSYAAGGPTNLSHAASKDGGFGLSKAGKAGVIVGAVVGAIALLILLLFLLWRRKKKPQRSELTLLRAPSTTTFLSANTRDGNLTALPIRRPLRDRPVENVPDVPAFPARVRDRLSKYNSSLQDLWKTANPPSPRSPSFAQTSTFKSRPSRLQQAETAESKRISVPAPLIRVSSHHSGVYSPMESIRAPSTIDLEGTSYLATPHSQSSSQNHRWSWTTSYATARSRYDSRSLASAISTIPGLRSIRNWMQRQPKQDLSEKQHLYRQPSGSGFGTVFKNKATKPNLAPRPTRELSRRQVAAQSGLPKFQQPSIGFPEAADANYDIPNDGVIS